MNKQLLVTKSFNNTLYQLYKVKMLYPASFNDYRGTIIEQDVLIDAYGIIVVITDGQKQFQYDSGTLSAHNYQVNWLFHHLHRSGLNTIEEIRDEIWSEYERWCWNPYGNPFRKTANQLLRRKVKRYLH